MNNLDFREDGSPTFQEYDIVNLGRTGFVKASDCNYRVESGAIVIEKATGTLLFDEYQQKECSLDQLNY